MRECPFRDAEIVKFPIYMTGISNLFTLKITLSRPLVSFLCVKIGSTNEFASLSWDVINAHQGQIYCQFARISSRSPWKYLICIRDCRSSFRSITDTLQDYSDGRL